MIEQASHIIMPRSSPVSANSAMTVANRARFLVGFFFSCLVLTFFHTNIALSDVPFFEAERASVVQLPPISPHWLWVPDRLLAHSLLFDGDSGDVLGMIDSQFVLTPQAPLISPERSEIYSVDVDYARGNRGERIDYLTIYDLNTMAISGEIVFPTHASTSNTSIAYSSRIGSRFIGVFNQFPATSVSILDLEERKFVEEIGISGCSGLYEVDERRFATLCGDGTVTVAELNEDGGLARLVRSKKFFDTLEDPVFTAAGRIGLRWLFISFAGNVHIVDFTDPTPIASAPWSLTGDSAEHANPDSNERQTWRPSGLQLVAVHADSQRLFVVMNKGGPGSHKDGGPEIWTYDIAAKKRIGQIRPPALTANFLAGRMRLSPGSFSQTLLEWVLPADTIHSITVSQDAKPLLFVRNAEIGAIGVIDPISGTTLRILGDAGLVGPTLRVP